MRVVEYTPPPSEGPKLVNTDAQQSRPLVRWRRVRAAVAAVILTAGPAYHEGVLQDAAKNIGSAISTMMGGPKDNVSTVPLPTFENPDNTTTLACPQTLDGGPLVCPGADQNIAAKKDNVIVYTAKQGDGLRVAVRHDGDAPPPVDEGLLMPAAGRLRIPTDRGRIEVKWAGKGQDRHPVAYQTVPVQH
jgi:hypothetical protein